MRKLLISILIALLLFVTVYSVWKGLLIGNIKILGFNNIKAESENLDTQIEEITKLKEQAYRKTISDIESNAKLLLQEKEKYATLVTTSTDTEIEKATHGQEYEQDFLWAKIGNHATAVGVKLKFEIKVSSIKKDNYDLYFTVNGTYTNITEFIMALENDNLLGFKIENFKLVPTESSTSTTNSSNKNNTTANNTSKKTNTTTTNTTKKANTTTNNTTNTESTSSSNSSSLQATFKVTDISINIDKSKIISSNTEQTIDEGQTNKTKETEDETLE